MGPGKRIAIVTGASVGIGAEFAKQIDTVYELDEIWLVARRKDGLERTAKALERAKGVVITTDLTERQGIEGIVHRLDQERPDIKVLVNNAGFGKKGKFTDIELQDYLDMIDLNVRAVVHLTYQCLKFMGPGAHILNLASMAGLFVLPSFNVYSATKAFVIQFSYGLRRNLKPRRINVTAVAPGPVKRTEFKKVLTGGRSDDFLYGVKPKNVVKLALKDVARNKKISVAGLAMKVGYKASWREPEDDKD
jgi:short-subunit dehydrogenase